MKDYIKVKFNLTKFYRDNDIIFFYPSIVILRYNITKIVGSYNYKKKKNHDFSHVAYTIRRNSGQIFNRVSENPIERRDDKAG